MLQLIMSRFRLIYFKLKHRQKERREPCIFLVDRSEAFEVKVLAILKGECRLWLNISNESCQFTLEKWFLLLSSTIKSD